MRLQFLHQPLLQAISHIRKHWFLYLLGLALAAGFSAPGPVSTLTQLPGFRSGLVASVLFLMGLTLQPSAIKHSINHPKAGILALGLNVIGLPMLAALLAIPLPSQLGAGLIVVAAVPCTLASASIWTRRGAGNDAVSMLVTLLTNLFCFLITPATLRLLIGQTVEIDFVEQVQTLALIVVLPLILAQLVRLKTRIANWADFHKVAISVVAQVGILVMVASGPAAAILRMNSGQSTDAQNGWIWIVAMIAFTILLHLVMLFGGWKLSNAVRLSHEDSVAVAISGSQKTLMVGLQIAIDCGVSILPMIVFHVAQLIIDTFWVDAIRQRKIAGSSISGNHYAQHNQSRVK